MRDLEKIATSYMIRDRSDYQLRHFVIGQHDTPQMQYRQILMEIKQLVIKIRFAQLSIEKQKIKLQKCGTEPLDLIKAEEHRINIAITQDAIDSAEKELEFLIALGSEYPQFSPEEIEANQPEYWAARLQRQATIDRMGAEQQISAGNLMSLMQAGLLDREITR